jgi:integrase/recombinase XerD
MSNPIGVARSQTTPVVFPLVDEWARHMRALGRSPKTIRERQRLLYVVGEYAGVQPEELTSEDLLGWLASKASLKTSSRASFVMTLQQWFKWLQVNDYRVDDPMRKVGKVRMPPGIPRPLTDAQVEHLLKVVTRRRMRAYLVLAGFQGLRVHEIAKVRGEDLDELSGLFHVVGKGGVVAELPLHPYTRQLAAVMPRKGWWFPSYKDPKRPVLGNSVSNAMSKFMDAHGVRGTAHQLRHWHATAMLQNGTDVRVVQTMMRHATLTTTQRYTAVNRPQQSAAMSSLPMLKGEQL